MAGLLEFGPKVEIFLSILPLFSGFLSLIGSGWIIVEVVTTRAKIQTVYNRLLLGMSVVNAFTSVAYMFSTIPMPVDSTDAVWAHGNTQTCTAQGFFIQLGIIPPICKYWKHSLCLELGCCESLTALI